MRFLAPFSVAAIALVLVPAARVSNVLAQAPQPQPPEVQAPHAQPSPAQPPPEQSAPAQPAAIANPLAVQPLDRLSTTRERPLFSPTRRPPAPPPKIVVAPAPPAPPPPPPNVALYGIVMDGEEARAMIRSGPTEKMMRVRIGDDVGGWKVAQIEGRKLVLSLDGRLATFTLFAAKPKGAPNTPPPATAIMQPQNQLQQNLAQPPDQTQSQPRRRRRQAH